MLSTLYHQAILKKSAIFILCGLLCNCFSGCDSTSNRRSVPYKTVNSVIQDETISDDEKLEALLDKVIKHVYFNRELNTTEHAAWQILHGSLAYGKDFLVRNDEGRLVRVLDHLQAGGRMNGWTMRPGKFYGEGKNRRQGVIAVLESGSGTGQGHSDQWIAVLSQCGLSTDWKFDLYGRDFTIGDLIYQTQQDVAEGKEMSWTIIALMNYLNITDSWTTNGGNEAWNLKRILELEAKEEINTSACGGTHRLIGMSMCLNKYNKFLETEEGKAYRNLDDTWNEVHQMIQDHIDLAKRYQSVDGSFSSRYFQRPSYSQDLGVRLGTTGHILEFLAFALNDDEIREHWVKKAAIHMCEVLLQTEKQDLECGKLYHAMHGVILYRERLGNKKLDFSPWAEQLLEEDRKKAAREKKQKNSA